MRVFGLCKKVMLTLAILSGGIGACAGENPGGSVVGPDPCPWTAARWRGSRPSGGNGEPSWSPDGARIAFRSVRDGNSELCVMNADGGSQVRLTNDPAFDGDPVWSPDGTRILFSSTRTGDNDLWVIDADGQNPVNLTNSPAFECSPAWSPDGTRISFVTDRDGDDEVYVMNADGSAPTNLTNNPAWDWASSWSQDGTTILFDTDRNGNWEVYALQLSNMTVSGSRATRRTIGSRGGGREGEG